MSVHPIVVLMLAAALAPATAPPAGEALPPPAPGREVLIDSRTVVSPPMERQLTLSDIDPETAAIVKEINRKPGTWQLYLLYTAEDLPEIMFHPGFAIRLPDRRVPALPEPEPPAEAPPPPPAEPATAPVAAPARASAPPPPR